MNRDFSKIPEAAAAPLGFFFLVFSSFKTIYKKFFFHLDLKTTTTTTKRDIFFLTYITHLIILQTTQHNKNRNKNDRKHGKKVQRVEHDPRRNRTV